MSQPPVELPVAGAQNDRDAIWAVVRRFAQHGLFLASGRQTFEFSVGDVRDALPVATSADKIRRYLGALTKAGYLERIDGGPITYTLVNDVGVDAPRVRADGRPVTRGDGQTRVWRALHIGRGYITAVALAAQVSTPEAPVSVRSVETYLRKLHQAGYLQKQAGWDLSYRLIPARYSGPRAPIIRRNKQVFDTNSGRVAWPTNEGQNDD